MKSTVELSPTAPLVVRTRPVINLTDDEFFEFCQLNRDLRIERTCRGEIVIMSPTGARSGMRNAEVLGQLVAWSKRDGTGVVFDSSSGFTLPSGAVRSPDAAWILKRRLALLTPEQLDKFAPICPDFVVEIGSPSDTLSALQEKMQDYMANGAQLGWLLDPGSRCVYVYRSGRPVEELDNPQTLSGEPLLAGFVLDLGKIW